MASDNFLKWVKERKIQFQNCNFFLKVDRHSWHLQYLTANVNAGNPYWRGRLNTVALLVSASLDQLLLMSQTYLHFYKTSCRNEEANPTEPSPSVSISLVNVTKKRSITVKPWVKNFALASIFSLVWYLCGSQHRENTQRLTDLIFLATPIMHPALFVNFWHSSPQNKY